ncbi:unnamed protein product [Notodromas monacha]|uniref:Uncharacterized protein n=1 Tax=Notodromas monacha TaxID=399045 RepID=A0A7R9GAN8_9CRUS|nr:unnamed protein product [Notodromas monacha]CAG0914194.1 unnamed protein product [Notodromas monacha]
MAWLTLVTTEIVLLIGILQGNHAADFYAGNGVNAAYRQLAAVTGQAAATGMPNPGFGAGNRRYAGAGIGVKNPGFRRYAKDDLQASASSSFGSFGYSNSPALRALALLAFLFFLQQIQTLLTTTGRRKRSLDHLMLDEELLTANLDLSTWARDTAKAAVPLAIAYFVDPRVGRNETCIQRTVCQVTSSLNRHSNAAAKLTSALLNRATDEFMSRNKEEMEANENAVATGKKSGDCSIIARPCSDHEFSEITRVSDRLINIIEKKLPLLIR